MLLSSRLVLLRKLHALPPRELLGGGLQVSNFQNQAVEPAKASPKTKKKAKQISFRDKAALEQRGDGPYDLNSWRAVKRNLKWYWGSDGASEDCGDRWLERYNTLPPQSLAAGATQVLQTACPAQKCATSHAVWRALVDDNLPVGCSSPPAQPARPVKPEVVSSREIPSPKESALPWNVYMLLNLAHVELNAIDIAWDTVARFSSAGLPRDFYIDFAHIAEDESRHFGWCMQRLKELGFSYGDMVAHDMLWMGAQASSGDVMARLVVGPCSQEARGLDAGPRLTERLMSIGDRTSAAIVHQISKEEMAHVAAGTFWFRQLCAAMNVNSTATFRSWLGKLCPDMLLGGNYNHSARKNAGLEQAWYDKQLWTSEDQLLPSEKGQLAAWKSMNGSQMKILEERLANLIDVEGSIAAA